MTLGAGSKGRIGGWLHVPVWIIGNGALLLGLEREDGHLLAAAMLLVACLLWGKARGMLVGSSKIINYLSLAVPVFWAFNVAVAGIVQVCFGYWDWFPALSASLIGLTLLNNITRRDEGKTQFPADDLRDARGVRVKKESG